mgnify:CR=1 FL=1
MKRHPITGNKKSRKHSFSGFFIDLRKSMTAGEIKEHFSFDSDMSCIESAEKAFRKYIETT